LIKNSTIRLISVPNRPLIDFLAPQCRIVTRNSTCWGGKKNKKRYKVDDKMSIKLEEEEFLSTGIEIHDFRLVFFHRRR
jgi:hypothetical protein